MYMYYVQSGDSTHINDTKSNETYNVSKKFLK